MRAIALAAAVLLVACSSGDGSALPATTAASPSVSAEVGGCWEAPATGPPGGPLTFADATSASGLDAPLIGMEGHAVAFADVDQDGWLDLFVGSFADRPPEEYLQRGADAAAPDQLLRGGPDGFRVDEEFPGTRGRTSGASFADLDGDGDLDLVAARNVRADRQGQGPGDPEAKTAPTTVYENEGDGRFREAATLLPEQAARAIAVLDYDGDEQLDLFIGADGPDASAVLLRNRGGFEFDDVTGEAGLPTGLTAFGVASADLDGDGRSDLVVAGSNRVFQASGDGQFNDVTPEGFDWSTFGEEDIVTGVAIGDLDVDGRPDVVVGQHFNSTVESGEEVPVRIFHNESDDGELRLREITEESAVPAFPTKAPHVEIADFDNDGWPDLLVTASADDGAQPVVLRNEGDHEGPSFSRPSGLGDPQYWVTGGVGDVDHDGRLDVFVTEFDPAKPSLLLQNTSPSGHWIGVDLGATALGGIGATVSVYEAGRAGDPEALLGGGIVVASTGYAGGAAPIVHVGLGAVDRVDVAIRTADGTESILADQPADQMLAPNRC